MSVVRQLSAGILLLMAARFGDGYSKALSIVGGAEVDQTVDALIYPT